MSLMQMSIRGGVLILFIVTVRALALHHLPKSTFLILWEVAALRLLTPFSFRLPFGFPVPVRQWAAARGHLTTARDHLAAAAVSENPAAAGAPSVMPGSAGFSAHTVFQRIWLAGFILTAAYFFVCYVRAKRSFQTACPDTAPAVQSWLQRQKLRRPLEVRQSDRISSPLTYGVFRPVILLPKEMERGGETALTYILTHEFIHVRRFDAVKKLIFATVLCIHWFNPLVWVMVVLANRDLELSCDERAMHVLGGKEKAPYALTLIAVAETQSRQFPLCNHFGKLAIEERIEAIMKYKKTSVLAAALAVVLILGAATAFAASAPAEDSPLPGGQGGPLNTENLTEGGSQGTEGLIDDSTLMSYFNPDDGKTYYSWDNGQTVEPLTEEEVWQRLSAPRVEWWTYEEYAAWLENEKVELQAMLGEKGWTGGRGDFVWTQEIIDETIAMYESILEEIKKGKLYSKSVDGDPDALLISGGADSLFSFSEHGAPAGADADEVQTAVPEQQFGRSSNWEWDITVKGEEGDWELYLTPKDESGKREWHLTSENQSGPNEDLSAFHPTRTEEEWQQIIADIENGKIPPYEIPDDPNVTVHFVDYAGGNCVAGS